MNKYTWPDVIFFCSAGGSLAAVIYQQNWIASAWIVISIMMARSCALWRHLNDNANDLIEKQHRHLMMLLESNRAMREQLEDHDNSTAAASSPKAP